MKKSRIFGLLLIVFFIIIQFFQIDKTNEPEVAAMTLKQVEQPPAEVLSLLESACADCHSNNTQYPWYASIQPVGWWLRSHIRGAKMNMNYSTWGSMSEEERSDLLKEAAEEIENDEMPPKSFKMMHPEANLSDDEKERVVTWLKQAAR